MNSHLSEYNYGIIMVGFIFPNEYWFLISFHVPLWQLVYLLEKCPQVHCFKLFVFWWVVSSLYVLDIRPWSDTWFADNLISFCFLFFLRTTLIMLFDDKSLKFWSLIYFFLLIIFVYFSPVVYSRFSLAISFIHSSVYIMILSLLIHPTTSSLVSMHLFSISVSLFLLCKVRPSFF